MSGCANRKGEYVPDSLEYSYNIHTSLNQIGIQCSFEVTTPDRVNYTVEFNITVYHNNTEIYANKETKTLSPSQDATTTVSTYFNINHTVEKIYEKRLTLKITDVTVMPKEQDDEYQSYAIGFGTAGGAVLLACIVLFVVLKAKEKK